MRAKTILTILFVVSLCVAAIVFLRALPQSDAAPEAAASDEILVATAPLTVGTLLRAQDVTWHRIGGQAEPGQIVRPVTSPGNPLKLDADEDPRSTVYGAALRAALKTGEAIWRADIIKPGD